MFLSKFAYDLTGRPRPTDQELDEEISRLLYLKTAEEPNYLIEHDKRDTLASLDSDVLTRWITRKFKPTLIILLLESENNYAKSELSRMERYKPLVDKFFRINFVERYATREARELCFENINTPSIKEAVGDLKRTLTFLSNHLGTRSSDHVTLLGTDLYSAADVTLYSYLKRILVGKYKDLGLASHVKLCEPLISFMRRYASKNNNVIDVSAGDPLANTDEESSLLVDFMKPAIFATGLILFFLWARRN